jgi:predicted secreted protein
MRLLLIAFSLLSTISIAHAQEAENILTLPAGQALIHISATESLDVTQDLLIADMRYQIKDPSPSNVQDQINKTMAKALEIAKKYSSVKAQTGHYSVNQTTVARTKETTWQGSQGLQVKSTDNEALLKLVGDLQKIGLITNGLTYTVSPERAADIQDNMMEAALKKLQTRAMRAAKALGKNDADLIEVNVQGGYIPQPAPMYRGARMEMAAMSADMAAPVASAGETTLSITVSAKALIKP